MLENAIISACLNLTEDNITDYLNEIYQSVEDSLLDGLDDDALRVRLMETVHASVSYMVLTRLGYSVHEYVDNDAFARIFEYNTPSVINVLGVAVSDISEICLREIERTEKMCEKNKIRTFDTSVKDKYNEDEKYKEDGGEHYDLQNREQSSVSEFDATHDAREDSRQVRD